MLQRPPYAAALRARERAGRFHIAHFLLRHHAAGTDGPPITGA